MAFESNNYSYSVLTYPFERPAAINKKKITYPRVALNREEKRRKKRGRKNVRQTSTGPINLHSKNKHKQSAQEPPIVNDDKNAYRNLLQIDLFLGPYIEALRHLIASVHFTDLES